VVFNLLVAAEAALMDGRMPDHVLLEGPAGLGKTSLARCLAERVGARFLEIPATSLDKVGSVASALAAIGEAGDGPCVVFIDEIHGVCKKGQLLLLSALEDGCFQPSGCERIDLAEFCLVGATTNPGLLSRPLKDRFTVAERLDYYADEEITAILARYADKQGIALDEGVAEAVAAVGRGVPRVATALLRRVATFARVGGSEAVSLDDAGEALARLGIDGLGLDRQDRALLDALCGQSAPIGVAALAAQLGTDEDSITAREPYLLRMGLLRRSSRGRVATRAGYRAMGLRSPVWVPA
jgi:Holliday junction DNA helicase RuvB